LAAALAVLLGLFFAVGIIFFTYGLVRPLQGRVCCLCYPGWRSLRSLTLGFIICRFQRQELSTAHLFESFSATRVGRGLRFLDAHLEPFALTYVRAYALLTQGQHSLTPGLYYVSLSATGKCSLVANNLCFNSSPETTASGFSSYANKRRSNSSRSASVRGISSGSRAYYPKCPQPVEFAPPHSIVKFPASA
jgi:hypothetical protein